MISAVLASGSFAPSLVLDPRNSQPAPRPGEAPDASQVGGAAPQDPRENSPDGLTPEERRAVAELQQVDRQVRAHEQAHLAAAGGLARGVSFVFVTGPDGKQYAVGGEVSLDTSPASTPEATIRKARQIRAAANAPANPSSQDRAVATQASQMEQAARQELAEQKRQEQQEQNRASQVQAFTQNESSGAGTVISLLA